MCTQGDQKVAQPEVLHLLLARNECDKVNSTHWSSELTPSQQ